MPLKESRRRGIGALLAGYAGIAAAAMLAVGVLAQDVPQTVLPRPEPPSKARIGQTYKDSQPDVIAVPAAPAGAPNVLLIVIDDVGYGAWGTFGGQIPTPSVDRLAKMGLRYTRFHTTALCSPTRAALLTGRNHHSAGAGVITEMGTGYPGYTGQIPKSTALVAEVLRQNGYSTAWYGKNHNVPDWETSIAGPYDRWPILQGFDHFFGFVGGEANQWAPGLFRNNERIAMEVPKGREGHYTLNDALADEAVKLIYRQKSVTPDRPLFIYFAPGAMHAPHHVPKKWIDKFKGQFDQGWDKYREETYQRQLKLGVIPADTKLTPRPKAIPAYDSLTLDQKKVAARLMEAFAGFAAQTDYEIGRILDALDQTGQLNNTLIFCMIGDNGSSMEGTLLGAFNELAAIGGIPEETAWNVRHLDEIGGPKAYNHFPVGWAWATNTPFQWGKQVASHFGGIRNPLVIAWPDRIKDAGGIRWQFHHVIDVVPTILQAVGIPEPTMVNGVAQKAIEGVSMVYSFDDAGAEGTRKLQYFELLGNRALYKDGWMASVRHGRLPWITGAGGSRGFEEDTWELYDLRSDYSQYSDVAAKYPDKLEELQEAFWVEARKYQVLPLDDRIAERMNPAMRPSLIAGRTTFTYYQGARIADSSAAPTQNRSHTITAYLDIPRGGAEGVVAATGGAALGFSLYVKDRLPVYEYNYYSVRHTIVAGQQPLEPGANVVRVEFLYDGRGLGKGATVSLFVNDTKVGQGRLEATAWVGKYSTDETFDVGEDSGSPVSQAYAAPNRFTGTIRKLVVDSQPAKLTPADQRRIAAAERAAAIAQ
ncbi:sulfatase-like hydrolase/transferase [Accumulibacter sp.]|uniref:sulfatase-like hydrolase/transferase n=1 Tax=Accumulibacter sp. TaxID=2053492 RepID=UPI0025E016F0|nr:sulfatase-like hydrolase/transferase [Accumulibacter sp.]MCM8627605.1 sulfatase-like hydrolase/transferase [Accumulibacter sp.]